MIYAIFKFLGSLWALIIYCAYLGIKNAILKNDASIFFLCIVICYCSIQIIEAIRDASNPQNPGAGTGAAVHGDRRGGDGEE